MLKKVVSFVLVICFLISAIGTVQANSTFDNSDEINASGRTVTLDFFKNAFGSQPESKSSSYSMNYSENPISSEISLANIVVEDNVISFIANVETATETVVLPISGAMYSSYKSEQGVNCIVIDADCAIKGYSILLLEIYNDDYRDGQLLYRTDLEQTPHIKLYIRLVDGNISLFELPVPNELSSLCSSQYPSAHKSIDILWPLQVIEGTTTEVATDDSILRSLGLYDSSRAANTWTLWTDPKTYFHTFYYAGYEYHCVSLPYVEYRYTNVGSQDGTWIATFKVAENTTYWNMSNPDETETVVYGNNVFEYRNVGLTFACGDNTIFLRVYQAGRMRKTSTSALQELGDSISVDVKKKIVSSLPLGTTYATLIGYINTLSSAGQSVTLGSTNIYLLNTYTVTVGEQINNHYFEECTDQTYDNQGDYFTIQAVTQYEAAGGNTNTLGILNISYNVISTADWSETPRSGIIQFSYSASE